MRLMFPQMEPLYTPVIDGALRAAVEKVGSELFTIVHKPEKASELTHAREWLSTLDDLRNWLIRAA